MSEKIKEKLIILNKTNMKTNGIILILLFIACLDLCQAQVKNKYISQNFQSLLDKYETINPPVNYKKIETQSKEMTRNEAIRYFNKKEQDLYHINEEMGEDDVIYSTEEEYVPKCKFKYQLNDNIYMLCTLESSGVSIEDSSLVILYSFTKEGIMIDKCIVGGVYAFNELCASFILLDKNHIRIFYYKNNYLRKEDGFLSTVYYVNYEITGDGQFIEKDKSDITYLKKSAIQYSTYEKKMEDDLMNEY
ncbi:hypothetical protein FACS18947_4960 [Bacteroidia bacterium]|nr:hypothetical protein FACS18947_4960 [Bacteroidia bacterium]